MKDGLRIFTDTSGVTLGYEIYHNGYVIMMGDGYEDKNEILTFLNELRQSLNLENVVEEQA